MAERKIEDGLKERVYPVIVMLPDRTLNRIKTLAKSRDVDFETEFYNIFSKGLTFEEAVVSELQRKQEIS